MLLRQALTHALVASWPCWSAPEAETQTRKAAPSRSARPSVLMRAQAGENREREKLSGGGRSSEATAEGVARCPPAEKTAFARSCAPCGGRGHLSQQTDTAISSPHPPRSADQLDLPTPVSMNKTCLNPSGAFPSLLPSIIALTVVAVRALAPGSCRPRIAAARIISYRIRFSETFLKRGGSRRVRSFC